MTKWIILYTQYIKGKKYELMGGKTIHVCSSKFHTRLVFSYVCSHVLYKLWPVGTVTTYVYSFIVHRLIFFSKQRKLNSWSLKFKICQILDALMSQWFVTWVFLTQKCFYVKLFANFSHCKTVYIFIDPIYVHGFIIRIM